LSLMVSMNLLSDKFRADLVSLCERAEAELNITPSRISRNALNDSMFVGKLARGDNVTLGKARKLESWLRRELQKHERSPSSQSVNRITV
jgi:hypothetical protein